MIASAGFRLDDCQGLLLICLFLFDIGRCFFKDFSVLGN